MALSCTMVPSDPAVCFVNADSFELEHLTIVSSFFGLKSGKSSALHEFVYMEICQSSILLYS